MLGWSWYFAIALLIWSFICLQSPFVIKEFKFSLSSTLIYLKHFFKVSAPYRHYEWYHHFCQLFNHFQVTFILKERFNCPAALFFIDSKRWIQNIESLCSFVSIWHNAKAFVSSVSFLKCIFQGKIWLYVDVILC